MSRPRPSGRSYGRLTRHERNAIERMLDRNRSAREIAAELGRSPSTVTREVAAHRYVTAPRSRYGEPAPEDLSGACPRLAAWPRCCNGCSHRRGYGCSRRPRVFYSARRAQEAADAELSSSRSGIDETEEGAAAKLAAIRGGLARGLSPQQIAATTPGLSASTVYRWVDAGYDGMTNMELRRKVGYRPRKRAAGRAATRHSARRSHAAFLALGEDACAAAWEMDTVEGAGCDSARLLTLLHRPSRFQLALPLPDGACASVLAALSSLRAVLGEDQALLLRPPAEPAEGRVREEPRGDQEAAAQGRRGQVRPADGGGLRAAHVAGELRAEGGARVPDAGARAADGPRGGRLRPHGRVRGGGAGARRARPHARLHRQGQGREGRGAAGGIAGAPGHGPEGPLR